MFDEANDFFLQLVRCDDELLVIGFTAVTREIVEEFGRIATHGFFASEEANVFVHLGGDRVVVARGDVHVSANLASFFAHDEDALGVGLQSDEAVVHVHTGEFELATPRDVARLIEPSFEFKYYRDLLA